jgi:hypothetical protein
MNASITAGRAWATSPIPRPKIAAWLYEHDVVERYMQSTYDLATGLAAMGNLKGLRENLNFLVDVLAALAKLTGQKVIE